MNIAAEQMIMQQMPAPLHVPILTEELLHVLEIRPGSCVVDATVGGGGHTLALAAAVGREGHVVGLDRDRQALQSASRRLAGLPVQLVQANFAEIRRVLDDLGLPFVDAIVADLGFSTDQMFDPSRGLSFRLEGPLDMRFDPAEGPTARDLVHELGERELADLIFQYGEERFSRRIARAIVAARCRRNIETTSQLAEIVRRACPVKGRVRLDPATRTFQALRIAVNQELPALTALLSALPGCVRPGGRVGIISFHSLEDRLVKTAFKDRANFAMITRKPIRPGAVEISANPRARSARLRAAQVRPGAVVQNQTGESPGC